MGLCCHCVVIDVNHYRMKTGMGDVCAVLSLVHTGCDVFDVTGTQVSVCLVLNIWIGD